GANLSDARNLDQELLDTACGDSHTILPDGMKIKTCKTY
ncbi:MAG: pentapeptide repeat-containing protein, partial [Alphaproteobacteria bacterium]|nr:pentapeptide repeat-containing protein [Alphaproteobacteria bacterium]